MALKASDFTIKTDAERHELDTPAGKLVVFVKPMTWLQQQQALSSFVDFVVDGEEMRPKIDFGGYWRYVLVNCIESTSPSLSKDDLFNLTPEVGNAVREVLPKIEDLMGGIATTSEPSPLE
jgi:hypothetical protein